MTIMVMMTESEVNLDLYSIWVQTKAEGIFKYVAWESLKLFAQLEHNGLLYNKAECCDIDSDLLLPYLSYPGFTRR